MIGRGALTAPEGSPLRPALDEFAEEARPHVRRPLVGAGVGLRRRHVDQPEVAGLVAQLPRLQGADALQVHGVQLDGARAQRFDGVQPLVERGVLKTRSGVSL